MASALDDDTRQSLASGRATLGSVLGSARDDLQKAFLIFVVAFMGTFYLLRMFVWDRLRADLNTSEDIVILARTPFDVILLQAKIGIVVGIIVIIPVLVYYGRDGLRARGWWPAEEIPRWKFAFPMTLSGLLFLGGITYAYNVFFPIMFGFLAENASNAGIAPNWSIVKWTEFIVFLSISFGLAAQLPLVMSSMTYLRITTYETFRDYWRHAIVGIFAFGALFSPPDPITQTMWALPLIGLYGLSLQLARFAQLLRRSRDTVSFSGVARSHWNALAGVFVLGFGAVYLFYTAGGVAAVNDLLAELPTSRRALPIGEATGLSPALGASLVGAVVGLVLAGAALFVFSVRELDRMRDPMERRGSPADIDLSKLDAAAIPATPPERFEAMDGAEATELAREALHEDENPEKAQAILDRFDEVQERLEEEGEDGAGGDDDADAGGGAGSTTAGVVDAFTEEETTEEDIGGYYTDIAFILESITSRAFRIAAVFGIVMSATFVYLYQGGIGEIRETFTSQMPESQAAEVDIVALHPVEALVFEVKVSVLLGLIAVVPVILYYMWPRLRERGLVAGDQRVIAVWGVTLVVGVIGGSLVGFFYVAPAIISWLAADAVGSNMVISYRINNFGWLVIFTTVGIGLLIEIPVTMFLFHRGGLVPFAAMWARWRVVVMAVVALAAILTPSSLLTMLVFAVPVSIAYLAGLGFLWVYTLGGRRTPYRGGRTAD